ncbi:uncharacterized protein MONBRDRAFT_8492 [Monosiga brevicollis MX1]|uniref:Uncharacterized protein n=1 Tax=Monosiga brevicollis TaxID=81824 RepID=A9V071_MONBE|nr:uncharacterized protein MONBRDRAFT_8492 [Monosiga brevicollis MX1]EDQ88959.1 predicted protein [Monosiga brevicollis MX1]|eukprot:XP_001746064.1 hypothetical protein [Monosiga brevicollis MX1]
MSSILSISVANRFTPSSPCFRVAGPGIGDRYPACGSVHSLLSCYKVHGQTNSASGSCIISSPSAGAPSHIPSFGIKNRASVHQGVQSILLTKQQRLVVHSVLGTTAPLCASRSPSRSSLDSYSGGRRTARAARPGVDSHNDVSNGTDGEVHKSEKHDHSHDGHVIPRDTPLDHSKFSLNLDKTCPLREHRKEMDKVNISVLIAAALKSAPEETLSLAEIYEFVYVHRNLMDEVTNGDTERLIRKALRQGAFVLFKDNRSSLAALWTLNERALNDSQLAALKIIEACSDYSEYWTRARTSRSATAAIDRLRQQEQSILKTSRPVGVEALRVSHNHDGQDLFERCRSEMPDVAIMAQSSLTVKPTGYIHVFQMNPEQQRALEDAVLRARRIRAGLIASGWHDQPTGINDGPHAACRLGHATLATNDAYDGPHANGSVSSSHDQSRPPSMPMASARASRKASSDDHANLQASRSVFTKPTQVRPHNSSPPRQPRAPSDGMKSNSPVTSLRVEPSEIHSPPSESTQSEPHTDNEPNEVPEPDEPVIAPSTNPSPSQMVTNDDTSRSKDRTTLSKAMSSDVDEAGEDADEEEEDDDDDIDDDDDVDDDDDADEEDDDDEGPLREGQSARRSMSLTDVGTSDEEPTSIGTSQRATVGSGSGTSPITSGEEDDDGARALISLSKHANPAIL